MTPLRIAYNDQAKLQALTVSSEASGYPGVNAVHPHLSRVWRSTACAAEWIKFDAGAGLTILFDTACIVGHNLTSAAVVRVQTDDADGWAPPGGVNLSGDPTRSIIFVDLRPSPTARRYARVYIEDAANPDGYVRIGRVFLCTRFEGETIDRGFRDSVEDTTVVSRSLTGQVFADVGVQHRVYAFSLGTMRNSTRLALKAVLAANGTYDPVVVFPGDQEADGAEAIPPLYACLTKLPGFTDAGGWGWTDDTLEFREAK
jgi:hypothetical protein